jgi:hypothetical protein
MTHLWHEGGLLLFRVTGMALLQGVQGDAWWHLGEYLKAMPLGSPARRLKALPCRRDIFSSPKKLLKTDDC